PGSRARPRGHGAVAGARLAVRRAGAAVAAVHGLQQREMGNARRGPKFLPRRRARSVDLRRAACRPPAEADRRGPDPQVLGLAPNLFRSIILKATLHIIEVRPSVPFGDGRETAFF